MTLSAGAIYSQWIAPTVDSNVQFPLFFCQISVTLESFCLSEKSRHSSFVTPNALGLAKNWDYESNTECKVKDEYILLHNNLSTAIAKWNRLLNVYIIK